MTERKSDDDVALAKIMLVRAAHLRGRVVSCLIHAVIFGPLAGWTVSAAWFTLYACLQAAEARQFSAQRIRVYGVRRGPVLAILAVNSLVFGAIGLFAAAAFGVWGLVCGVVFLTSGFIYGALANQGAWLPPTTVRYITDAQGKVTEFQRPDFTNGLAGQTIHRMDCRDCHNRPAHQFRAPGDAVELAMSLGKISTKLPNIKKEAFLALMGATSTKEEGLEKIAASLRKAYTNSAELDGSIAAIQAIYRQNFFPEMKTDWRTYPNNIGHKDWPGCFRCHDGKHKSSDGKRTLGASDCNSCHTILAQGSGEDLKKLNPSGHTFFHIDAPNEDFNCHNCHTGALLKE